MNSRERVLTVIEGKVPDMAPITLHNFQMATQRLGRPFNETLKSAELLAEAMLKEWDEFRHDIILLEIGTACSAEAMGVGTEYDVDRAPIAHEPAIESLDEVDTLTIPEDLEERPSWAVTLGATRILRKELPEVAICGRADQGPFSLASMLRGMEDFMVDIGMGEEDEKIHKLMELAGEVVFRYARAMKEAGADCTSIGESFAGPDLMRPDDYRRLAWPHEKDLIQRVQNELSLPMHLHICGSALPILEDMVQTGALVVEVDQATPMKEAKEICKGRAVIHGNIEPERCIFGTPEEVARLTKQALEDGMAGGGLMIGPGCALGGPTPAENIRALVDTAREYGKY